MNRWGITLITALLLLCAMGYQRAKLTHASIQVEKLEKEKQALIEKQLLLELDIKRHASHVYLYHYWQDFLPHLDFPGHHQKRKAEITAGVRAQ